MKKTTLITSMLLAFVLVTSCATKVERIDADTVTDLSGYWNDTDVRIVADTLVEECVNANAITNYINQNNKLPVVIVGTIRNDSDEHLDTSILAKKFEAALINSGRVDFVASAQEREQLRDERNDQQINSSDATASRLGNETGADFMLIGAIKTIVDSNTKDQTRTYYVNAELVDIETNRKLWIGENSEIKKYITRASARP